MSIGSCLKLITLVGIYLSLSASIFAFSPSSLNQKSFTSGLKFQQNSALPSQRHYCVTSKPSLLVARVTASDTTIEKKKVKQRETVKKDEKTGGEKFQVRLYNDPFNKREFVARCLVEICGKNDGEAFAVMMEAHNNGKGVIGRYMFEQAETYLTSLKEQGLMVDMVPVED